MSPVELEAGSNWRERYRVRIGFAFGLLFVWRAQPRALPLLVLGFLAALAGVLFRQWAAGCVRKNDELARTGPYALVRHPLYVGSFLTAAGFVLASTSFSTAVAKPYFDRALLFWCFLWILADSIYFPKIRKEEDMLRRKFGTEFESYEREVPRFVPRLPLRFDFSTFRSELWLKNKEYGSLIGYLAIVALLIARYYYR